MHFLLLGFVAYALLTQFWSSSDTPDTSVTTPTEDAPATAVGEDGILTAYSEALFPDKGLRVYTEDKVKGPGLKAVCGSTASIRYDAKLRDGTVVDSNRTAPEPLILALGSDKGMPALRQAAEGMRIGGKRLVSSPAALAYGHPDYKKDPIPTTAPIFFDVEMVDVKDPAPALVKEKLGFKVLDARILRRGQPVYCGGAVGLHVTIWDKTGIPVFDTLKQQKPLRFTIGQSQVPLGIEMAALGMVKGTKRTVVLPPEYARPLLKEEKKAQKAPLIDANTLPEGEYLLVDIERVE